MIPPPPPPPIAPTNGMTMNRPPGGMPPPPPPPPPGSGVSVNKVPPPGPPPAAPSFLSSILSFGKTPTPTDADKSTETANVQQPPKVTAPPPMPPAPTAAAASQASYGGFNTHMIQQVHNTAQKDQNDSDNDGWSDDDSSGNNRKISPLAVAPVVNKPVTKSLTKPPIQTKPPPVKYNNAPAPTTIPPPAPAPTAVAAPSTIPPVKKTTDLSGSDSPKRLSSTAQAPPRSPPTGVLPPPLPSAPAANTLPLPLAAKIAIISASQGVKSADVPTNSLVATDTNSNTTPKAIVVNEIDSEEAFWHDNTNLKHVEHTKAKVTKEMSIKVEVLEKEVEALQQKLQISQETLTIELEKSSKYAATSREIELGKELDSAYVRINKMKTEKLSLEQSVKALQARLSLAESKLEAANYSSNQSIMQLDTAFKKGDRESDLEAQLISTKRDKDKAIKLVVLLIGKDKVAEFLKNNAGCPDILDKLVETFSSARHVNNLRSNTANASIAQQNRAYEEFRLFESARSEIKRYLT